MPSLPTRPPHMTTSRRGSGFLLGRAAHHGGHEAHGRDIDQAFAHVAGVKHHLAEGGGNAAFVAAVPYPFDDAVQQAPRDAAGA
jgi:hypothetical protein